MTEDLLSGMKAITTCVKSIGLPAKDDTVLGYIVNCGMPAKKLGGIWISKRSSIVNWALAYCDSDLKGTVPEEKQTPNPTLGKTSIPEKPPAAVAAPDKIGSEKKQKISIMPYRKSERKKT